MYNIAWVDNDKCIAEKGCRLCIMYCPEADTIMMDEKTTKAIVIEPRCKGCDLCKVVCSTHNAITLWTRPRAELLWVARNLKQLDWVRLILVNLF